MELSKETIEHIERNNHVYMLPSTNKRNDKGQLYYGVDFEKVKEHHLRKFYTDLELIKNRKVERYKLKEIKIGDYVKYLDGHYERVTHVWSDGQIQTYETQRSFYIGKEGGSSYSGSLNSGLQLEQLQLTKRRKPALFWFFSDDWAKAHNGISFYCMVNVWKQCK